MLIYEGKRTEDGAVVLVDGKPLEMTERGREHSPTGFEWGYGGSGPAALAHSLLTAALISMTLTADRALEIADLAYMDFKDAVVARLNERGWRIEGIALNAYVLERYGTTIDAVAMAHFMTDADLDEFDE